MRHKASGTRPRARNRVLLPTQSRVSQSLPGGYRVQAATQQYCSGLSAGATWVRGPVAQSQEVRASP